MSCAVAYPQTCVVYAQSPWCCLGLWNCHNPQVWVSVAASQWQQVSDPVVRQLFKDMCCGLTTRILCSNSSCFTRSFYCTSSETFLMVAKSWKRAANTETRQERETLQFQKTKWKCTKPLGAPDQGIDPPWRIGPCLNWEKRLFLWIHLGRGGRSWIEG